MNRRTLLRNLVYSSPLLIGAGNLPVREQKKLLRPDRLRPGDTVALISPASFAEDDAVERAYRNLEALGLRVRPGQFLRNERGYHAGTREQRYTDLHAAFADPTIKGVWCVRGGVGAAQLLPFLDFKTIRRNPKVFIGYSDITALHVAIQRETGLVTFHGPVASSEFTDYTQEQVRRVLFEPEPELLIQRPDTYPTDETGYATHTFPGPTLAEGPLTGGNLTLLAAAAGTGYEPDLKGKLLFLEDVGERVYRIDRMLTQLRQAWDLGSLNGIALGIFADCQPPEGSRSLGLIECFQDRLGDLGVPLCYGLPIGHIDDMCTLPMGVRARLDTENLEIRLLEPGVR